MAFKIDTQKEIIFGSSDPNISRVLSKKEKDVSCVRSLHVSIRLILLTVWRILSVVT